MRAGAHLIAGSLSGSLALATGKEPLRTALSTQLRQMLHGRLPLPELETAITVRPAPGWHMPLAAGPDLLPPCCILLTQLALQPPLTGTARLHVVLASSQTA